MYLHTHKILYGVNDTLFFALWSNIFRARLSVAGVRRSNRRILCLPEGRYEAETADWDTDPDSDASDDEDLKQ